jgi:hypothetical protein
MQEKKLYDDLFYIVEQKYGLWKSYDKENKPLVTSLTEEDCVRSSRFYLQLIQENRLNDVEVTYSSTVDGKL